MASEIAASIIDRTFAGRIQAAKGVKVMTQRRRYSRAADTETLHDGVPVWLQSSLVNWLDRAVSALDRDHLCDAFERRFRDVELLRPDQTRWAAVLESAASDAERFLDFIQMVLEDFDVEDDGDAEGFTEDLRIALSEGGSKWDVEWDEHEVYLCERVDETAVAAFREVVRSDTSAAAHLARAWRELYGRQGDPTEAYEQAVKAVEAACVGVAIPKDPKPTLGKVIAHVKQQPKAWAAYPSTGRDPVGTVIRMMELLWTGQEARHAKPGKVPVKAAPADADAAVHLAVVLVRMWETSAISRR